MNWPMTVLAAHRLPNPVNDLDCYLPDLRPVYLKSQQKSGIHHYVPLEKWNNPARRIKVPSAGSRASPGTHRELPVPYPRGQKHHELHHPLLQENFALLEIGLWIRGLVGCVR